MEARARSERGGGEAELRPGGRGSHDGRRAAEGRDEEEEEEVEAAARDGALSSLACMLPAGDGG